MTGQMRIEGVADRYSSAAGGSVRETTDAAPHVVIIVFETKPSAKTLNAVSAVATNDAKGVMYYNAVANQQRTNLLGLAMTAKCVRYMLGFGETTYDAG